MICPFIIELDQFYPLLNCLVFGVCCLAVATLNWLVLPETAGVPMPETVEDILNLWAKGEKDKKASSTT